MRILTSICLICLLQSCLQWKTTALYDEPLPMEVDNGLRGFSAPVIWQEQLNSEIWVTQEPRCITMKLENAGASQGQNFIHLKWNKQAGNCPWLGIGCGWEGWSGKDISMITQSAMLSFKVKNYGNKPLKAGLPGALGFEDFSGNQSFVGMLGKYVSGGMIGQEWTQFEIPLADILSQNSDLDPTAIKQMIITLESEGEIGIDDIVIQPMHQKP
jgi:hypothetical protein